MLSKNASFTRAHSFTSLVRSAPGPAHTIVDMANVERVVDWRPDLVLSPDSSSRSSANWCDTGTATSAAPRQSWTHNARSPEPNHPDARGIARTEKVAQVAPRASSITSMRDVSARGVKFALAIPFTLVWVSSLPSEIYE